MFLKNRYKIENTTGAGVTLNSPDILSIFGIDANEDNTNRNEFGEVIYFICLNHMIQTMAKMPRLLYQESDKGKEVIRNTQWKNILNREPNPIYTASTLWSSVELNRLHHGNAYIYLEKQGKNTYLWVLPSSEVQIYIDDAGIFDNGMGNKCTSKLNPIWYIWNDKRSGKMYSFNANEILHYKTHVSLDGLSGLSVKDILAQQLKSLKYSESYQHSLFKNNLFGGKIILQYTGDLCSSLKTELITEVERYANSVGSGKFLPIPMSVEAKSMDMKLTDADFVELNKLSGLQIAACFGVKPNVLNNYDKSSYSNSETQQLDWYVNSLQPIFKMYSDEDTRKLLSPKEKQSQYFEIDKNILFELNKETQMNILAKGINNFMYTPNEAREILSLPYDNDPNANKLFGNGNLIAIDVAGQGANYKDVSKDTTNNSNNSDSKGGEEDSGQQQN